MTSSASTETFVNSARGFRILMITSIDHTGRFDGRPMTLLAVEDEGTMWFACPSDSDLVTQFGRPAPISITGQTSSAYLHTNGIAKAIVSLSMFHQGRIWCMDWAKERNRKLGYLDDE